MTYLFEPLPDGGWLATSPEFLGLVASAATVPATLVIAEDLALRLAKLRGYVSGYRLRTRDGEASWSNPEPPPWFPAGGDGCASARWRSDLGAMIPKWDTRPMW